MAHTQYPDWTYQSQQELDDLYWISTRAGIETDRPWVHGITQTLSWLAGRSNAPITERPDQPVTKAHAEAEKWFAVAINDPLLPVRRICTELDVDPLPATPGLEAGYVNSVWRTLRWALGDPGVKVPFDIPRRDDNGNVITVDQRYREATRHHARWMLPEDERTLRASLHRETAHDEILASIIEDTRRSIAS